MEKFDTALDSAKAALRQHWFDVSNADNNSIILEHLIHAIDLLGDEVAKLKEQKYEDRMKIYTVMSRYEPVPLATFSDYHELIKYIRRQKFNEHKIYESVANSWNEIDEVRDFSASVYADAYNGFNHFTDKNY